MQPYRNHTKPMNKQSKRCSRMSYTPTGPAPSKSRTKNAQGTGDFVFFNAPKKKAQWPYEADLGLSCPPEFFSALFLVLGYIRVEIATEYDVM